MDTYKYQGQYYRTEPGSTVFAAIPTTSGVDAAEFPMMVAVRIHTEFKEEIRLVFPKAWWDANMVKTTKEDMGLVQYFNGKCPHCDQGLAIGAFDSEAKAAVAVRAAMECRDCGESLTEDEDGDPYEDRHLTTETKFDVIKPYVDRHMRGVK